MILNTLQKVINRQCDLIILGSMPGMESLRLQQYYAHPRNQFWRLIYALDGQVPSDNYAARLQFALAKGIALWDVLNECEREGSLDARIQKPVLNDFQRLFADFPQVKRVYCNGTTAYDLFKKKAAPILNMNKLSLHLLPSSSPAHTIPFADKWIAWKILVNSLEND